MKSIGQPGKSIAEICGGIINQGSKSESLDIDIPDNSSLVRSKSEIISNQRFNILRTCIVDQVMCQVAKKTVLFFQKAFYCSLRDNGICLSQSCQLKADNYY
jgi:hypothetical protein